MRKILVVTMITVVLLVLSCGVSGTAKLGGMVNSDVAETREDEQHKILIEGDGYPYVLTDYMNNTFKIKERPENFAILSGTFINLWYRLGGESLCTSDLGSAYIDPDNRQKINALPSIGPVYNPNTELVVEFDPTFTFAQVGTQTNAANTLNSMKKPAALLHMRSYVDVVDHISVFGKLLENEAEAEKMISEMEAKKKSIVYKLPDESKSIVIMYVTSSSLAVKLDNSIAGDVANILSLDNIASDLLPDTLGSETTPLDVEYIAQQNPDMILVTSMIASNDEAMKMMNEEFSSNPVWTTVEAVTKGNILYLPQEYFLYNAAHKYMDAVDYMAKGVYPEIYSE